MNVDLVIDDPVIRIDSTDVVIDTDYIPTAHLRVRPSRNDGRHRARYPHQELSVDNPVFRVDDVITVDPNT
jgi:hypothetical protein